MGRLISLGVCWGLRRPVAAAAAAAAADCPVGDFGGICWRCACAAAVGDCGVIKELVAALTASAEGCLGTDP
jgi:hypothetical protein